MQSPKMQPFLAGPKARLASATVSRTAAAGPATRILIVDQDRQVGVSLSFMLSARRFDDVRAVRSANRAVAITEQFRPEIVFLDVELPDDGVIAVARKLARDACKPRPRLIALTPDADHPMHEKTRSAGFERFLVKPVSHEELDEILGISRKA